MILKYRYCLQSTSILKLGKNPFKTAGHKIFLHVCVVVQFFLWFKVYFPLL